MAHPVRALILSALENRTMSPTELAAELGRPLGMIAYHVRVLEQSQFIELAGTSQRRGAIQHHYRLRTDEGNLSMCVTLPRDRAEQLVLDVRALVEAAVRESAEADGGGRGRSRRKGVEEVTVAVLRQALSSKNAKQSKNSKNSKDSKNAKTSKK
jgi:predicted transcriptional regulator